MTCSGTATFDTASVGTGKTVTVSGITLSGAAAGNYTLASPTATTTANITAVALTPSVTAANKVYDGTTATTRDLFADRRRRQRRGDVQRRPATFDTASVGDRQDGDGERDHAQRRGGGQLHAGEPDGDDDGEHHGRDADADGDGGEQGLRRDDGGDARPAR